MAALDSSTRSSSLSSAGATPRLRAPRPRRQPGHLVRFRNTFESDGITSAEPVCSVVASFFEGISESVALTLTGRAAEGREGQSAPRWGTATARSPSRPRRRDPRRWTGRRLESEWRALDTEGFGAPA